MSRIVDAHAVLLAPATAEVLASARQGDRERATHHHLVDLVPALGQLEIREPPDPCQIGQSLHVAAWNAERCMFAGEAANFLAKVDCNLVLLTEMDLGMARSGNRNTTADLAAALGAGYVFGVEFVETGRGSPREAAINPHLTNSASFHGNAILSRHRLADAFLVRLDDGAVWFTDPPGRSELRLGGRNAIVARLADAPVPIWVASVHLESASDADDRAVQVARLLAALDERAGPDAMAILGGDFNTNALPRDAAQLASASRNPEPFEPLFIHMRDAGFEWHASNVPSPTQRTRPDGAPPAPHTRLDWLFVRGLVAHSPATLAAVDAAGAAISDHDAVSVQIVLPA